MSMKTAFTTVLNSINTRVAKRVTGVQSLWNSKEQGAYQALQQNILTANSSDHGPSHRNEFTRNLFPFGDGSAIREHTPEKNDKVNLDTKPTNTDDDDDNFTLNESYILLDYDTVDVKTDDNAKQTIKKADEIPTPRAQSTKEQPKQSDGYFEIYRNTYIRPVIRTVGRVKDILPFIQASEKAEETTEVAQPKPKATKKVPAKIVVQVPKDVLTTKTFSILFDIKKADSKASLLKRLQVLSKHLEKHPEATAIAVKHGMVKFIRSLLAGDDRNLRTTPIIQQCHLVLALLGVAPPTVKRGVRILAIDGGGTRGLISIDILRELELRTGQPIYQLFDYICGVSTGALIAAMMGIFRVSPRQTEAIYKQFSTEMFDRNTLLGTGNLVFSLAYYDAEIWERILRNHIGEKLMVDTAKNPGSPKMGVVSCLMNGPVLKTYVFRSYNLPPGRQSVYIGSSAYKIWQAIRASSAAPGYFPEFALDGNVHLDGGLHTNNPAAVAIHECKCLWPDTPIQCVVSLGNGRYEPIDDSQHVTSHKVKITKLIQSATDTEAVHSCLQDLLPRGSYFRFNPYMSEDFQLDEIRPNYFDKIQADTRAYIQSNDRKLQAVVKQLLSGTKPNFDFKSTFQRSFSSVKTSSMFSN